MPAASHRQTRGGTPALCRRGSVTGIFSTLFAILTSPLDDSRVSGMTEEHAFSKRERVRPRAATLYRHFDSNGVLLYVRITAYWQRRLQQHECCSTWIDIVTRVEMERFATRREAQIAETQAIQTEKPLHNRIKRGTPKGRVDQIVALARAGKTKQVIADELRINIRSVFRVLKEIKTSAPIDAARIPQSRPRPRPQISRAAI
jgi:hypothetical protein